MSVRCFPKKGTKALILSFPYVNMFSMTRNQTILTVVTILIILAGIALYLVPKKATAPTETATSTTPNTSSTTSTNSIDVNGVKLDYTTKGTPGVVPVDTSKLPPAPSLAHVTIFSASITSDIKPLYEKKIADNIQILKQNKYSLQDWINLGILYKEVGDYQAAKDAWVYASLLSPGNVISFNNLGDLYHYYLKDYPKAESSFLQAVKNDPKYVLSYVNLFDLYRLSYQTNTSKAADILKQGIAAVPENIDLVNALAGYYKDKGDTANAKLYYQKALSLAQAAKNKTMVAEIQSILSTLK